MIGEIEDGLGVEYFEPPSGRLRRLRGVKKRKPGGSFSSRSAGRPAFAALAALGWRAFPVDVQNCAVIGIA
jgi:hypothetical protein